MAKYTIGVDFGSLSGRALLVNVENGQEIDSKEYKYPHGVMDEQLPGGEKLDHDWALQHPKDYIEVFENTISSLLKENAIDKSDVIGIGVDFTACTVLPVKADGTPLCFIDEYKTRPHAYVKLWKHHAAQDQANRLNSLAHSEKEDWINRYGGKISSEWAFPKLWQIVEEDFEIYEEMDRFIEATDWVTWMLTGEEKRNSCTAGYKAMWHKKHGFPENEFFKKLDPRLDEVIDKKFSRDIVPLGARAGELSKYGASITGLLEGTPVSVANVDAHVTVPAVKIYEPGKILAIMGTSTCHILLDDKEVEVPGICGVVEDGVLPGLYGYEAGQACVGDSLAWFVDNCVPEEYEKKAREENLDIHEYLTNKAAELRVGESGLVALDWWNGNRTILVDVDLTGVIVGMNLLTKPEEIYRALIESTAFGTKVIIDNFRQHGVEVNEFYASGGISQKNPFMMQVYSDVLDMPIKIAGSEQGPALGSAIFAAVAAGSENGGYDSVVEASKVMGKLKDIVYYPNKENALIYEQIYKEYLLLHDYFGRGTNDVMKRLKNIKAKVSED